MNQSFLKKTFFIILFFGLFCGQSVLACEKNTKQECGSCGWEYCNNCSIDPITKIETCNWSGCDEPDKPDGDRTINWNEYRCQGDGCANQYIETRIGYQDQTRSVTCQSHGSWSTGSWSNSGVPYYGLPSISEPCDLDWQLCSGSSDWTKGTRQCACGGECLETPTNPRYYDDPNYPTNPFEPESSKDSNNVFLPVKLDWDNTKASKDGWKEDGQIKACEETCFQSYSISINGITKSITDSEYNPTQDQKACFLKSGATYNWGAKACCNADGTNCGSLSNWSFTTNSAPELITPADPDWKNEREVAQGIQVPVTLDWCDVETAKSYRIRLNYINGEEEICHPWLATQDGCGSKIINVEKLLYYEPGEDILASKFEDKNGYFTKDTEYRWEITTCIYNTGAGCSDFGQKWGFKTLLESLPEFKLFSPQNDPSGESSVGLPLTLDWEDRPGINSFIYEINDGEIKGTTNVSQILLNYPDLSLNTLYKWRVKPCWDYKAESCEDIWSDEWYFKTTGASPKIISPILGSQNIPIPIKLEWKDVGGAKSYKYWLYSGAKLIASDLISGTPPEADILIEYNPDTKEPKQETNYSWQVATCADKDGKICGLPTIKQNFKTFKLSVPSDLSPGNNERIFTYQMPKNFSWESDAIYFNIILNYINKSAEESSEDCKTGEKSIFAQGNSALMSLDCLGQYEWRIQACLDKNCQEKGEMSSNQSFVLDQTASPSQFGLVPCNRSSDNPQTPWNERDSCQLKHIFILTNNVLDLLLWKISILVLTIMTVATAVVFYLSIGKTELIINIKAMWQSVGKGFAIIFLAWTIINIFLAFLGYRVGIFGPWWQIKF
jgi:hypothetical protein